jgi:hypothetical protein
MHLHSLSVAKSSNSLEDARNSDTYHISLFLTEIFFTCLTTLKSWCAS